jgi:D-lactate dehydrogenase (cytochrome)
MFARAARGLRCAVRAVATPRALAAGAAAATAAAGVAVWCDAATGVGAAPPPSAATAAAWADGALVAGLTAILGDDGVLSRAEDTASYGSDLFSYHAGGPGPAAVAFPATTAQVAAVVKLCASLGVPIVARGAGTSIEGHVTTPHGGCVVDLSRMDRLLAVRPDDLDATVQAGVVWGQLNEALARHGLVFPVDPGPGATIGGMVGTSCSGTNAHRYGIMRHNVLSLTVVLPDGSVVTTGRRARKSSAGYDLTSLFTGSEGTLGIVTEAHVKLAPLPAAQGIAVVGFPDVASACAAVGRVLRSGVQLGAAELMDAPMVAAVNAAAAGGSGGGGADASHQHHHVFAPRPHLLFKFTGSAAKVADDAATVQRLVAAPGTTATGSGSGTTAAADSGVSWTWSSDPDEQARLWHGRKVALWSAQAAEGGGRTTATTDVCVPLSSLPALMAAMEHEVAAGCLAGHVYGLAHAGDGNAHHIIAFDPAVPREVAEAHRLADALVAHALALDGTCTGEHGVGVGKRGYLVPEFGARAVQLMHAVKDAVDPAGIMTPGKKLPPRGDVAAAAAAAAAGGGTGGSGAPHHPYLHTVPPACCS